MSGTAVTSGAISPVAGMQTALRTPVLRGRKTRPFLVPVFLISLALPLVIDVAGLRLSPYRIILLTMFLPSLIAYFFGSAGRMRTADFVVFLIAAWSALSFGMVHGVEGIESAGMVLIETLTPYLLARQFIRTPGHFHAMVKVLVGIVLCLLPFAVFEALTGRNLILALFDLAGRVYPDVDKPLRLELDRVQGPFEHPILFGVICGSALALSFYLLNPTFRLVRTGIIFLVAFLSLSSGPLAALAAQAGLISWDRILRRWRFRWYAMILVAVSGYIVVDLISNRTPPEVFISLAAFDPETAYNRLLIWEWGWVNIASNPWFGLGHGDWQRLWFMTDSVDMFWMQRAMVHGLPVGLGFQFALLCVIVPLIRCRSLPAYADACRTALLICLAGFYIAGMTVHFLNATFVLFMFVLGSGAWMLDGPRAAQPGSSGRAHRGQVAEGLLARPAHSRGAMES
ncbi:MAG: O-antigen ligase family protein [Pseudomonadota bacterium]